ncbi:MAG: hypothetical protein AB1531_03550 [Chloroflexota bacterium]
MKKIHSIASWLLMILLVSACSQALGNQVGETSNVSAWFDAPLPGTVFWPPNPCQIVAHGASPAGIALFELGINGAQAASIPSPDTQSSLVTLVTDCGLSEPGEYLLELRVQDNDGNWSGFAETNLIIAGDEEPPAPEEAGITPTPTAEPAGTVSIERVSDYLVYLGRADCGTLETTITVRASAPNGIKVVMLFYRFQTSSATTEFLSVVMTPIGGDLYQSTLNPTSLLGGSVPFDQATLQYQVVVQQNNDDTSLRTPVLSDITMQACGG